MEVTFPTTEVILLAYTPYALNSFHAGRHIQLGREDFIWPIPHEMAHYYFNARAGRIWFYEGGATFFSDLFFHRTGLAGLHPSITSKEQARQICGFENIRHLQFVHDSSWEWSVYEPRLCFYSMGRNFLHAVYETIGEEAMSSALREYFLGLNDGQHDMEQAIYRAFLKHTPLDRKEDFREIYRTLHGGPYAYPESPTTDDHGNEAHDATPIVVGEAVEGELDYMFDFDYFRFIAEQGRKYQMNVAHEALGATSVGIYASNPHISQHRQLESRELAEGGPQVVWVAPSSDEYYFAVHNFGGETGTYKLTITPVDD